MRNKFSNLRYVSILLLLALTACSGAAKPMTNINQSKLSDEQINSLLAKKIFFGHKSVGDNLLDGIREVKAADPRLALNLVQSDHPESVASPAFIDAHIGENGNPSSKNQAFAQILQQGMGAQGGVALYKYCYVDFGANTDGAQVFGEYKKGIDFLHEMYPSLKIVHVTAPLTTVEPAPKALIKSLLGKPTLRDENVKRNQFNRLLQQTYLGNEPIFDLAAVESTHVDGSREYFMRDGLNIYTLSPEYTTDGGHLNQAGRTAAAHQLLRTLASF